MNNQDLFVLDESGSYELIDDCQTFSNIIVRQVSAEIKGSYKDICITYFLARCSYMLNSIKTLYISGEYSDCLILYRALIDRLLLLYYLVDTDSFKEFDDWSFKKIFEETTSAKNDPQLKKIANSIKYDETEYRIARYNRIKKEGIKWKRPKAEDIAKTLAMITLYKYGYAHASGFVHPMSGDGELEYKKILGTLSDEYVKSYRTILNNSLIVFIYLLEESLGEYNFEWIEEVFDCQIKMFSRLNTGDKTYKILLEKITDIDNNGYAIRKKYGTQHAV
jgi:hypothetical protein